MSEACCTSSPLIEGFGNTPQRIIAKMSYGVPDTMVSSRYVPFANHTTRGMTCLHTRVWCHSWLKYCATNPQVEGSIPDGVIGIFYRYNHSKKIYWPIGRNSSLSRHYKLLLYKQTLKPFWTYGIQMWGCTKQSNIDIIQQFQNKVQWYLGYRVTLLTNFSANEDFFRCFSDSVNEYGFG